jgi:hypothetical protein
MPQLRPPTTSTRKGYDTVAVAMSYDPPSWLRSTTPRRGATLQGRHRQHRPSGGRPGRCAVDPNVTLFQNKRGEIVKQYVGAPDFAALHS